MEQIPIGAQAAIMLSVRAAVERLSDEERNGLQLALLLGYDRLPYFEQARGLYEAGDEGKIARRVHALTRQALQGVLAERLAPATEAVTERSEV